jgi:hypothetical protein
MRSDLRRQIVCEVCGRSCNAARDASRYLPPVPAQGAERSLHPLQPDNSSSGPPNGAMPQLAYVSHLDWKGYARTALEPGLSSIKRPNSASSAMTTPLFPDNCGSTSPVSQRRIHTTTFFSTHLLPLSIGRRWTNTPSGSFTHSGVSCKVSHCMNRSPGRALRRFFRLWDQHIATTLN